MTTYIIRIRGPNNNDRCNKVKGTQSTEPLLHRTNYVDTMNDMITAHYPHACLSFLITYSRGESGDQILVASSSSGIWAIMHWLIARKHILYPPFIALSLILALNRY
eukprot:879348_1